MSCSKQSAELHLDRTGWCLNLIINSLYISVFTRQDFGLDFVWGAATAAYQIEGAHNQDGRGPNIWDTFTHRPNRWGRPRPTGDVSCDFYHRYEADLHLLKSLGFTAFRFSISWSRIMPLGTGAVNQQGND